MLGGVGEWHVGFRLLTFGDSVWGFAGFGVTEFVVSWLGIVVLVFGLRIISQLQPPQSPNVIAARLQILSWANNHIL